MIGDKLIVTAYHRGAAARVLDSLKKRFWNRPRPVAITVAGESGSGKSETAHCLAEELERVGRSSIILAQDDYFRLPPRSNHRRRLDDISWVGPGEVRLDLLDQHLKILKNTPQDPVHKPLVYFEENQIKSEEVCFSGQHFIIAEGTYTTLLENADFRVFIDRTFRENREARLKRDRDPDPDFLERVLAIEHKEISRHRQLADLIIEPPEGEP